MLNKALERRVIKDLNIEVVEPGKIFLLRLRRDNVDIHAILVLLEKQLEDELKPLGILEKAIPTFIMTYGDRKQRRAIDKILSKIGLYRGWLRQSFIKEFDEHIRKCDYDFELGSLVYELRMYKEVWFIAGGTANFWPRGVKTLEEALKEFLLPLSRASGYYVFIKSLQFKIARHGKELGTYIVDRWARVTALPKADKNVAIELFNIIAKNALENYIEHAIGYHISISSARSMTLYSLEAAKDVFLEASDPGPSFFDAVKSVLGVPHVENKRLVMIPIYSGNPRIVTRVIDKKTGAAADVTATYSGIRITPALGSPAVSPELVDSIVYIFQSLLKE